MTAVRSYLPWLRQGLAGSIPPPPGGGPPPGQVSVPVRVWINDPGHAEPARAIDVPVAFYGPGDVSGLDPTQVVRTEPRHQTTDAEPNFFAHLELDRPDLPWLFTPAAAGDDQRLAPWLVLVVVPQDAALVTGATDRSLPALEVDVDELPDLAEAWAWAHAQVLRPDPLVPVADALERAPERTVGRLVCPRRLDTGVRYLACLVPAFAAGRKAGLGEEVTAADRATLAAAWPTDPGAERARVPIYYSWEFVTGDGGEFESLARRLRFRAVDANAGTRSVDLRTPGWGIPDLPAGDADAIAGMTTALVPLGTVARPDPWPEPARTAYAARLRAAITPGSDEAAEVRPPIYGRLPVRAPGLPADGMSPHWLRELNLDPRHRIAAGLGALVVRYQQEELMGEAWAQLPPELAAGPRNPQELAGVLRRSLRERHLAPLPLGRLDALASPLVAVGPAGGRDVTPALTPAFRRLARPHGPLGRRVSERRPRGLAFAAARSTPPDSGTAALADEEQAAPVHFAPSFDRPMFEALRDFFGDMLFPGIGDVPPNSAVLLETNPAFVEAFLVGLNTEMSRELLWRGYPADLRATYFTQFWRTRRAGGAPELADIAGWKPESHLGEHSGDGAGATLVLLLRGDLLRRHPRTTVTAVEAAWSPDGRRRGLGTRVEPPVFQVRWGLDTTLLGFPLTAAQAAGSRTAPEHPGWFFVVGEPVDAPRFGLDVAEQFGGLPEQWEDLSWGHVAADAEALAAIVHLPLEGPLDDLTRDGLTWGSDAAQQAAITQQRPFRLAVHASRWVTATEEA